MLQQAETPVRRNSLICPCCLQFVEGASFLIDDSSNTITSLDKSVKFTSQEFRLAKYLIEKFPSVAKKEDIYDTCIIHENGEGPNVKIVDVLVCKIRPRLADLGFVVETAWGVGYKIVQTDPQKANEILQASLRIRKPGSYQRWTPEHDVQLADLMQRKMSPTVCATMMKMPYMAVERAYKRLMQVA